jgi:hypothetical protein
VRPDWGVLRGTHIDLHEFFPVHLLAGVKVERTQGILLATRNENTRVSVGLDYNACTALHAAIKNWLKKSCFVCKTIEMRETSLLTPPVHRHGRLGHHHGIHRDSPLAGHHDRVVRPALLERMINATFKYFLVSNKQIKKYYNVSYLRRIHRGLHQSHHGHHHQRPHGIRHL